MGSGPKLFGLVCIDDFTFEGILARALIDWPWAKAASFLILLSQSSQFKAILRHSQIWLIAVLV